MHLLNCLNNINSYQETEETLKSKSLVVKRDDELGLYLVKYNKETCDMSDPDILKCRGLIMKQSDNSLVCVPPFKSIPVSEFSNIIPNLSDTNYEEFIDGTMINIFCIDGKWIIATRSKIGANCRWFSDKNFDELFKDSSINLDYSKLEEDKCYSVVLQHPDNRIVTEYNKPEFTLVSVIKVHKYTYEDIDLEIAQTELKNQNIDINIPKRYKFKDFMQAMDFVNNQDYQFQGLVMKYNGFRSKIRNTKYNYVKQLRGNARNMKYTFLNLKQNNLIKGFLDFFPEYENIFKEYRDEVYDMTQSLWNCYQTYYISSNKMNLNKKDMPYEFRPLCYDIHGMSVSKKNEGYKITWTEIKNFLNNLPPAKQLFVINYKFRSVN